MLSYLSRTMPNGNDCGFGAVTLSKLSSIGSNFASPGPACSEIQILPSLSNINPKGSAN